MNGLNELFEQILHSERNFKARINKLRELSLRIQQCQLELQQTREEAHTFRGELAVKKMKLADLEVNTKLFSIRRSILQEQRGKLAKTKRQLEDDLDGTDKDLETQRQSFLDDLTEFSQSYDLSGSGYRYREDQTKKKISVLQDELLLLETELTEMDSQREEVANLEEQLAESEAKLMLQQDKEKDLSRTLKEQESEVKQLEQDKVVLGQKLSKDPEFVRLQQELDACKGCPEELTCQSLTKELEELQRKCYHKNMRQQLQRRGRNHANDKQNRNTSLQRPGHYNPYTHQYVPAPGLSQNVQPSTSDHFSRVGFSGSNSRGTGAMDFQVSGVSLEDSFDADEIMNIVEDEWLVEGGEGEDEGWEMELDESELASLESDLNMTAGESDGDLRGRSHSIDHSDDFMEDDIQYRSIQTKRSSSGRSKAKGSNYTSTQSGADSGMRTRQPAARNGIESCISNRQPKKCTAQPHHSDGGNRRSTNGPKVTKQKLSVESMPVEYSTSTSKRVSFEPSLLKVTGTRGSSQRLSSGHTSGCSSMVKESPNQDRVLRKRPGESIYKAPGQQQQQQNSGVPKSAKKVRFHY